LVKFKPKNVHFGPNASFLSQAPSGNGGTPGGDAKNIKTEESQYISSIDPVALKDVIFPTRAQRVSLLA
jgi:hypothetical protein